MKKSEFFKRTAISAAATLVASSSLSQVLPSGGSITAGTGSITQSGSTMTINQTSQKLAADWQSFSIGQGAKVNFVQPNASAVSLNRVLGTDVSVIQGAINANGQVFLVNPNGILFSPTAQINVGGLTAATLNISNEDFLAGNYKFAGKSSASVENQGAITGDSIALIAAKIINSGSVVATDGGSVLMGAGQSVTLDLGGPTKITVNQGAIDALIENGGAIKADGGLIYLTAQSASELARTVINTFGVVRAQTISAGKDGRIFLLGGMDKDRISIGGLIDASAPAGGNGGFIETSAAHVELASDVKVTTLAKDGATGDWLIDPMDYNIAATGGDITGAALSAALNSTNVTIQSSSGATAGYGDINVNDAVSWSANKLTLTAARDINVNAVMTASGTSTLDLNAGTSNGADVAAISSPQHINPPGVYMGFGGDGFRGHVDFGNRFGAGIIKINGVGYTVIADLGAATSVSTTDLQGMRGNLAGNYVLGADIDASATAGWNGGKGFTPIAQASQFTGNFNGLGHTITGLVIKRPTESNVGLFGSVTAGIAHTMTNVGLKNADITGDSYVGSLMGQSDGVNISNDFTDNVSVRSSAGWFVGGLVGYVNGIHMHGVYATGTVASTTGMGVGGIVGLDASTGGVIENVYSSANVSGQQAVGGVVGQSVSVISNAFATGNITGTGQQVGGIAGVELGGINSSYSTAHVSGASKVGVLAGQSSGGTANFYDNSLNGATPGVGLGTTPARGMSSSEMMNAANYTSATAANGGVNPAWDMTNTWFIYDGIAAPVLRLFLEPLTVTATSGSVEYNKSVFSGGNGVSYAPGANVSQIQGVVSYGGTAQGAVNAGSYSLTASGLHSTRYLISYAPGVETITTKALSFSGGALDKVYDGNNSAQVSGTLAGVISGDTVDLASVSGAFADKNVGAGKTVTVTGSLGGADAANYSISGSTASASITAKSLSVSGLIASDKVYDGTTAATIDDSGATFSGIVSGDSVALATTPNGSFSDKNVGAAKSVSLSGVSLTGTDAANYTIAPTASTTASISAKALTVAGTVASDKVFDGNTTATLSGSTLVGVVLADAADVTLSQSGVFASANVGTGIPVAVTSTLNGAEAGNYTVSPVVGVSAAITAAPVVTPPPAPPVVTPPAATPTTTLTVPSVHLPGSVTQPASNPTRPVSVVVSERMVIIAPTPFSPAVDAPSLDVAHAPDLVQEPTPKQFSIQSDVAFAFDSAELTPAGIAELDSVAQQILQTKSGDSTKVVGHTDRIGTEKYNLSLSERRAHVVKAYLEQAGVSGVTAEGRGEAEPISSGCVGSKATAALIACLQADRRVEIETNPAKRVAGK